MTEEGVIGMVEDLVYNYSINKKGVIIYEQISNTKPASICYCE